jgi:hypothetical protein
MAPNNRRDPSLTDIKGVFGWDVLTGFYRLSATHAGCGGATSPVFAVPPPRTGLRLTLNCPPTTLSNLKVRKLKHGAFRMKFKISARGVLSVQSSFVGVKHKGRKKHQVTLQFRRGIVLQRGAGGNVTLTVKPGSPAAAQLRKLHHLKVTVTIVYESTYGAVLTKTLSVGVHR